MAATRTHIQEAIVIIGKKLFDDDWIGYLDAANQELIGRYMPHASVANPCPARKRRDLDRAIGRQARLLAQWNMAYDWLLQNGPTCTMSYYETIALNRAIARLDSTLNAIDGFSDRGPGRPNTKCANAAQAMVGAYDANEFSLAELNDMTRISMGKKWDVSGNTAVEARTLAMSIIRNRPPS